MRGWDHDDELRALSPRGLPTAPISCEDGAEPADAQKSPPPAGSGKRLMTLISAIGEGGTACVAVGFRDARGVGCSAPVAWTV